MAAAQRSEPDPNTPKTLGESDFASIKLTPPLVLTIALMFIIASDGNVDDAESSQIQSVIGQNESLVAFASNYVRHVPLPTFLSLASQGLSREDRLCIVSNLYDAMLSDGVIREIEQKTFDLLLRAFGIAKPDFAPHRETLQIKNDKSLLGAFNANVSSMSMTPHLALAASVLYMMSADGSIDKHEIGRLETLVVSFGGLQRIAVAYVKKTKRERFFQEASLALTPEQKLFILLNVYDTMTADGVVAVTEDKIFQTLLDTFAVKLETFTPHAEVLERKNLKPFDIRKVNVGQLFDASLSSAEVTQVNASGTQGPSMGERVSRTIEQNMANVQQDIGSTDNVVQIQTNALGQINLQQISAANDATHREKVGQGDLADHREKVGNAGIADHREQVGNEGLADHRESLGTSDSAAHRETIDGQGLDTQRATFDTDASGLNRQSVGAFEVRIDNLSDDIEALYDQLLKFEKENQQWLSMGKALQAEEAKNRAVIPADEVPNSQLKTPLDVKGQNLQSLKNAFSPVNRQKIEADAGADADADLRKTQTSTALLPQSVSAPSSEGLALSEAPQAEAQTPKGTLATHVTSLEHANGVSGTLGAEDVAGVSRAKLPPATQASKITQPRSRFSSTAHSGRVLPWQYLGPSRWGVKEVAVALVLSVSVPNLSVLQAQTQREARGVLVILKGPAASAALENPVVEAPAIELTGP